MSFHQDRMRCATFWKWQPFAIVQRMIPGFVLLVSEENACHYKFQVAGSVTFDSLLVLLKDCICPLRDAEGNRRC